VIQRLKDLGKFSTNSPAMDVVKEYGLEWNLVFTETMWFEFDFLILLTNQNTIKKVTKEMLFKLKKFPTVIMGLESEEQIIKVVAIKKWDHLGIISEWGKILIFDQKNVRAMWKTANWVKAIGLEDDDSVSDLFVYRQEPFIFVHDGANWKLVSYEDIADQKSRGVMKRWQSGVICHSTKKWQQLRGAIAIEEWGVSLVLKSWRIDVVDSSSMDLKLPNDPMTKLTNWEIIKMYRPWAEKEERRSDSE
jgi:DNA gyrase/topoisomerase IV subunit A